MVHIYDEIMKKRKKLFKKVTSPGKNIGICKCQCPNIEIQLCPKVYIPPDIYILNAIVDTWRKILCFGPKNASKFPNYDAKSKFRT